MHKQSKNGLGCSTPLIRYAIHHCLRSSDIGVIKLMADIVIICIHGNPEKMFPSNVLISLEAEKNPLSLIENPHKSPFRNFFYDHSKVELFSFLCSNFYKKILSITRQRKDATAVAQLTLILNARVSYHKCHTHNKLDAFWYRFTK